MQRIFYQRLLALVLLSMASLSATTPSRYAAQTVSGVENKTHTLFLEDERVWVHDYTRPGADGVLFINLHDNENTSVKAGLQVVAERGGRLLELRHGRGRQVVIGRHGKDNAFDPNRMFSDFGLARSLEYFGGLNDHNMKVAQQFRKDVLKFVEGYEGTIIALHNNTDKKLSIYDFKPDGWYGEDAARVHVARRRDPDDFFFTTDEFLYARLAELDYNVALMKAAPPDRGTLACWARQRGRSYVNVEAQSGHLDEQIAMIRDLMDALLLETGAPDNFKAVRE